MPRLTSVAKHRDAVRDALELVDPVRDVDDSDAARLEPRDEAEQNLRLAIRQRSRRLIQDENPQVAAHRLGDLDKLLLAARQLRNRPVEIDVAFERAEQRLRSPASLISPKEPVDRRLLAEDQVLQTRSGSGRGRIPETQLRRQVFARSAP